MHLNYFMVQRWRLKILVRGSCPSCWDTLLSSSKKEIIILVATSGDTGSAVANGFLGVAGTKVVVLYPSGKVSEIQEKQFTTLGNNVTALEVDGTFDDCQHLVKQAFLDPDLKRKYFLTSANSINIARLIPQSFYYFYAYSRLTDRTKAGSIFRSQWKFWQHDRRATCKANGPSNP